MIVILVLSLFFPKTTPPENRSGSFGKYQPETVFLPAPNLQVSLPVDRPSELM